MSSPDEPGEPGSPGGSGARADLRPHGLSALDEAEAYWAVLAGLGLGDRRIGVRALLDLRVTERVWWTGRGATTWARWWEVES